MTKKKLYTLATSFVVALLLSVCGLFAINAKPENSVAESIADSYEVADTVYDFTFTATSAFASQWGNQPATVTINNAERTMNVQPNQRIDGVMEMGSYHTEFDVKFGAGNYYSLFLRQNSGTRSPAPGAYLSSNIDNGADRGYRLFFSSQWMQLLETDNGSNNAIVGGMAPIDDVNPLGSEKYYTFEIWVLNLVDGSVQFVVDVDGVNYINSNTSSIANSLFESPILTGAMRINDYSAGSSVGGDYRGYDSLSDSRLSLFDQANFNNWTSQAGGALANSPVSWTKGGYKIGEYDSSATATAGWPFANASALVGSETVSGFSSRFTFNGKKVADVSSSQPYNLLLAYLEPGVKTTSWMGTTQNSLVHEGDWVNGYVLWINSAGAVELLKGTNSGEVRQVVWTSTSIDFTDEADHDFYFSVQNSPDRSYQIVTLEIDGVQLIDYHSYMPQTLVGAGKTAMTEEEQAKWLNSCPIGSFQIYTQAISGEFTNVGDEEFTDDYFVTDMSPVANNPDIATGITLENGVLTVPRGDKNGTDGNGYHWQEQVPVVTERKISVNSTIAFDFSATPIEGKISQLFINTNNLTQYPTTGTSYGDNGCILSTNAPGADVSTYLIGANGNGFWNGTSFIDGVTHRLVMVSSATDAGLTLALYVDGAKLVEQTYADAKYLHDGYFNMFAKGLDNITISNFSVYEDNFKAVDKLILNGTPKNEYMVTDELDLSGLTLKAAYKDGTIGDVVLTADMVSGFDSSVAAEAQTITVTYGGATASWTVKIISDGVVYKVKDGYKNVYSVNEEYANDIVIIRQENEAITEIPVTTDMITGFDTSLGGNVNLTISVEGSTIDCSIFVQKELVGIEVASGYNTDYAIGQALNYDDLKGKLNLAYNDGSTELSDITADMLSARGLKAGENKITVNYGGFEDVIVLNGVGSDAWDADGDGEIRETLTAINPASGEQMAESNYAERVGNTVAFGPSPGMFVNYVTKEQYTNYRMEYDMMISPSAADANQRLIIRGNSVNDGQAIGYFALIYKSNIQIYRKPVNSTAPYGYVIAATAFDNSNIGAQNIYDGKYHNIVTEVFNRADGSVVINVSIDGVYVIHFVDSASVTEQVWGLGSIPEADRRACTDAGHVGFSMNSGAATWIIKGQYEDESFEADTYLGNSLIYGTDSSAEIEKEKVTFAYGEIAVLKDEVSSFNAAFTLTVTELPEGENEIFATSVFETRKTRVDYVNNDGIIFKLYKTKAEITLNGTVLASLDGLNVTAGDKLDIKIAVGSLNNEVLVAVCIDGVWIFAAVSKDQVNVSGYVSAFAFSGLILEAKSSDQRNFRVLFVGNSITNHEPNADLGYTIGNSADSWGMATSSPEYDYVHLVMAEIRKLSGYENAEFMAINVANWEREYATFDYTRYYAAGAEFEPDLIIGRVGENAESCASSYKLNNDFTHYYKELLDYFNSKGTAQIILTTSYWGEEKYDRDTVIDSAIIKLARKEDYPLVRLGDLGSVYSSVNDASADGDYYASLEGTSPGGFTWAQEWENWSSAVKTHPGMTGMRNIAARISESVIRLLNGLDADISVYNEISDGIYAEYTASDLYGDVAGAYDYKKITNISATVLNDAEGYTFADNYLLYKAYSLAFDGDIYRLAMSLHEDIDASFRFRIYTVNGNNELVELPFYSDTESNAEAMIYVSGEVGDKLFICVEFNKELVFADGELSEAKYANIIQWVNKDNEELILDVSDLGYTNLVIGRNMYSAIISSGKDIVIKLADGYAVVTRETFEVISATEDGLYFSVTALTSNNYLKNATAAVEGLNDNYYFISQNESGYVQEVYEAQVSYNGRSGDALYVNKGIEISIPLALTDKQAAKLTVISAVLPVLGSEVKYAEVMDSKNWSYENGILTVFVKDFDNDIILALKGVERSAEIAEGYKSEYFVGDELSLEGLTLLVTEIDGEVNSVAVTEEMISGFNTENVGSVTVTVAYEGLTAQFTVNVSAKTNNSSSDTNSGSSDAAGCSNGCSGGISSVSTFGFMLLAGMAILIKRKNK